MMLALLLALVAPVGPTYAVRVFNAQTAPVAVYAVCDYRPAVYIGWVKAGSVGVLQAPLCQQNRLHFESLAGQIGTAPIAVEPGDTLNINLPERRTVKPPVSA